MVVRRGTSDAANKAGALIATWYQAVGGFVTATRTISTDIIDLAVGFKVNPYRSMVGFVNVFVPLNDDGLRAEVIPAAGLEISF